MSLCYFGYKSWNSSVLSKNCGITLRSNLRPVSGDIKFDTSLFRIRSWHFCSRNVFQNLHFGDNRRIFNGLVLDAQWELDHEIEHFWYLLILKRSFLAMVAVPSDSRRPKSCLEVGGILRLIELIFEFGVSIENPQNQKIHVRFVEKNLKKISTEKTAKNEQNPSRNGGFTVVLRFSPKWRFSGTFCVTT